MRLAEAVARLKLQYVVITSVARDDLVDQGTEHFAQCIRAIRSRIPSVMVEVLTPDFHARQELIGKVLEAQPDVYNHNLETVERLTPSVRPQANYRRSLKVLETAKRLGKGKTKTKSGLMVGLGERPQEIRRAMEDLRKVHCEILTIGQYLQPTRAHREVSEFVPLEQFEVYHRWAEELEFTFVASSPYARSSYNAYEALQGKER